MLKTRWIIPLALAAVSLPLTAQNSQRPESKSKDKVTTDDTVLKAGDEGNTKKPKQPKNRKAPKSPPNPPVVDPHENPSSPVNQPKTPAGAPAPK